MRRPALARAPQRALAALTGLLAAAGPAGAVPHPEVDTSLGRTFAIIGDANEGGPALQLAARWPVRPTWSAGLALWADDMGVEEDQLTDPDTGAPLGSVDGPAIFTVGGGWAVEAHLAARDSVARRGPPRGPFVQGAAGFYWVTHSEHGEIVDRQDTFGFSLGGGWRFPAGRRNAIGAVIRYSRVFADQLGRYVSAGIEWTWR